MANVALLRLDWKTAMEQYSKCRSTARTCGGAVDHFAESASREASFLLQAVGNFRRATKTLKSDSSSAGASAGAGGSNTSKVQKFAAALVEKAKTKTLTYGTLAAARAASLLHENTGTTRPATPALSPPDFRLVARTVEVQLNTRPIILSCCDADGEVFFVLPYTTVGESSQIPTLLKKSEGTLVLKNFEVVEIPFQNKLSYPAVKVLGGANVSYGEE